MKRYAMLAIATVFMFSTVLIAQDQQPMPKKIKGDKEFKEGKEMVSPEKRAEFMAKQLDLSAAEKAKVQALFEKQDARVKQHREEMEKLREERRAKFEAERKVQEAELIKIIGNEKFQQLQSLRIARLEKMNRMHKMRDMKMKHRDCPYMDQGAPMKDKKMMEKEE